MSSLHDSNVVLFILFDDTWRDQMTGSVFGQRISSANVAMLPVFKGPKNANLPNHNYELRYNRKIGPFFCLLS